MTTRAQTLFSQAMEEARREGYRQALIDTERRVYDGSLFAWLKRMLA